MNNRDHRKDRASGEYWENQFCAMARARGMLFTPHQYMHNGPARFYGGPADRIGKTDWTLPDVTIWSAPGEHHEIKHKNKTSKGHYGYEEYRLEALIKFANGTGQRVFYTIHDWQLAGAKDSGERTPNRIEHWVCADVLDLPQSYVDKRPSPTYYNKPDKTDYVNKLTYYWEGDPKNKRSPFRPLAEVWKMTPLRGSLRRAS